MKKYRVINNQDGNVIDQNLTYEQALLWTEVSTIYTMEPMEEDDQNDCDSL